jgi:hypothetical protein
MKKTEPIKSTAWVKKSKKLKKKYDDVNELQKACENLFGDHSIVMVYNGLHHVAVYPSNIEDDTKEDHRIHLMRDVVWYNKEEEQLTRMDIEEKIKLIVDKIKDKVNIEQLLVDRFHDSDPEELQEMFERVVLNQGAVKDKEGCYKLMVGGKKGKPYEFTILD